MNITPQIIVKSVFAFGCMICALVALYAPMHWFALGVFTLWLLDFELREKWFLNMLKDYLKNR